MSNTYVVSLAQLETFAFAKQCSFSQHVGAAESKGRQAVPSQDSLEKANGAPTLAALNPLDGCTGAALPTFLKANYKNRRDLPEVACASSSWSTAVLASHS